MDSSSRSISFLVILSAFMAFASLATDIFLPAMPVMQDNLGGSAALTITSFLVGFAIAQLLRMRPFMTNTLCVTFFYVAVYAFITETPIIYIRHFGVDPQYYGFLFGVNVVGLMIVSFFNRALVNRFPLSSLLRTATAAAAVFSLWLLADGLTGTLGLWGIVVPMFFVFSMNGIIAACSNAAALSKAPDEITGAAAALIGALQYGSGMISSALLAVFSDGRPAAMCIIIAVFVVLSALMAFLTQSDR